jgi:hypothetical protein
LYRFEGSRVRGFEGFEGFEGSRVRGFEGLGSQFYDCELALY